MNPCTVFVAEKQKLLAQNYTNKILEKIKTLFITSDASISDTTKKGGFGVIVVNKQKTDIIYSHKEKIDTNDAQKGELAGVESSLTLINENIIPNEKRIAVLCDCKNVIKYITNTNNIPTKYTEIMQNINELIYNIENKDIQLDFYWIPGHTDNKWNDEVDRLAKEAAALWTPADNPNSSSLQPISRSHSLDSNFNWNTAIT